MVASMSVSVFAQTSFDDFEYYQLYEISDTEEAMVDTEIDRLIDELKIRNSDRYTQVKTVNDWLYNNIEYDKEILDSNRSAYAALFNKKTVCVGFTSTFYKFMEKLNIPCDLVKCQVVPSAEWHSIAMVEMDDGYWYYVDPTFGTSKSSVFLCGTKTANTYYKIYESSLYSDITNNKTHDNNYGVKDDNIVQGESSSSKNDNIVSDTTNKRSSYSYCTYSTDDYGNTVETRHNPDGAVWVKTNVTSTKKNEEKTKTTYVTHPKMTTEFDYNSGLIAVGIWKDNKTLAGKMTKVDNNTIKAVAQPGYKFLFWSDGKMSETRNDIKLSANTSIYPMFVKLGK